MEDFDFSTGNAFESKIEKENKEIEDSYDYKFFEKERYFYMNENTGELDYDPNSILKNIHWGQLKLFMSELFALTYHADEDLKDLLYIGAAPGSHIYVLAEFFTDITFHLYDSRKFDQRLYKMKNIKINKRYFDEQDIKYWESRKNFFLVSDIRTLTYSANADNDETRVKNEESVWSDMKLQERWIEILRPSLSLIKFRLPFAYDFVLKEGRTRKYLEGNVCFQVYNKPTSSETRLLVKDISYKVWDIIDYERRAAYHNCITRNKMKFINPLKENKEEIYPKKGLFNDFDSTYFTVLVMDFIKKIGDEPSEKNTKTIIDYILENITPYKIDLNSKRAGF